jgi:glyoxylase-like metal-dependent hydrolase (beta-lactamase superfamily II)
MRRIAVGFALLVLIPGPGCQPQAPPPVVPTESSSPALPPPGADYEGKAFTFQEIKPGIYHAVGTGSLAVGCNGSIFVNEDDVLVVDSHITPAAAWALLKELKTITDKPVRYVVNTHFHFDHAHGNQVFPDDVEIIGHEFTRDKLVAGASKSGRSWDLFVGGLPARITDMEAELKAAQDASDQTKAAELQKNIEVQRRHQAATAAIEVTPPTTTLSQRMTLFRGGREIQLLYFGRGHTGGDVVVYLPAEKVVATGDLLTAGLSYMGDAYLEDWANTLEELKRLDFEWILPGHGEAYREKERIGYFQAYLRDLSKEIAKMHADGVTAQEAAKRIDMTSHAAHFSTITGPGVHPHAVERAYALLEGKEQ